MVVELTEAEITNVLLRTSKCILGYHDEKYDTPGKPETPVTQKTSEVLGREKQVVNDLCNLSLMQPILTAETR